ncbi:transcription-repair coupling factor (superfamily II helicase) [Ruminococcus sp. YRD2003]|uniref:transcription-repair coupling factor n=1 Tax=Ruminococcus sp. YRD2003 TaxID=1452313 RepID=UPI0008AABDB9|nr:transcription-repair coupling factor (superfamily II helicase) [Ruminococcus flavefaciens]
MKLFTDIFRELSGYKSVREAIEKNISPVSVTGLSHIHRAQLINAIDTGKVDLVITGTEAEAKKLCDDINMMSGSEAAVLFPSKELVFTPVDSANREYEYMRVSALARAVRGSCRVICASIEAVMQPVIPVGTLIAAGIELTSGQEIDRDKLCLSLTRSGYQRSEKVEGASQFSVRGDIIDIFPVQSDKPIRIELWGDEIESISEFETDTQRRSDVKLEKAEISPAGEILYDCAELADKVEELCKKARGKRMELIREHLGADVRRLRAGEILAHGMKYYPLVYGEPSTVFDYIDGAVLFSDYSNVMDTAAGITARYTEDIKLLMEDGQLCKGLDGYCLELAKIQHIAEKKPCLYMSNFVQSGERIDFRRLVSFEAMQTAFWGGELKQLIEDITDYKARKYRILLCAGSEKTLPIIRQDLEDAGIPCDIATDDLELRAGRVALMSGSLSSGFEYPENKTVLITQGRAMDSVRKRKARKRNKAEEIRSLADISEGDLVVHSSHGIGRFIGIRKLEFDGVIKDYITIQYAGTDKLYIPVTQLDMVSKYIGPREDSGVKLSKLSSGEWQKTRSNVKRAVKDMAHELIALYAKREKSEGFAFYPDDEIQHDFEERFPYVETEDQLTAIAEIKADMERIRPMERLLCGDVGFGKTEVAFRAAMKCILAGKQCAILAPTTVLAYQHYQTALRRFEHFPVNVELLSRYRSPKQQAEIVKKLAQGRIDLLIGTHKIIQKSVKFKDLGLAIIDEEQRFGVAHKEKFKEAFTGVDVLMLSATPIPRTLNMAMSGIRDMSVLEEPPQDRYPVQTYVIEYNVGTVVQAIVRELRRGGQVYYIHNRVESILSCADRLQQLLPDARIAVAHGQMSEDEMSDIWEQLVEHEIDILVCTTIIETGVDVPNVNTLIIEDSDRFGLSQLYQLRGRVGRSNRRGYAYFTYQRDKVLTEIAAKRLNAMREFTQFGSGFRIALRDLEIRGAGSILGGSQHGHMEAVGYDMYLQLLSEAIAEEKGEQPEKVPECLVDIQIDAHIPEDYITSLNQRIDLYKKIMHVTRDEDRFDLIDELIDRYGEPPKSVVGLIEVSLLRNKAAHLGITEISQRNAQMYFYTQYLTIEQIQALSAAYKGKITFNGSGKSYVSVKIDPKKRPFDMMKEAVGIIASAAAKNC